MKKFLLISAMAGLLTACGGGIDQPVDQAINQTAPVTAATDSQEPNVTRQSTDDVAMEPASSAIPQSIVSAGSSTSLGLTPQAVRDRYGFTAFDSAADQGSGQVIAIISAYNNPNIGRDLARFSQQHGLAACPQVPTEYREVGNTGNYMPVVTRPQPGDGCTLQVINLKSNGRGSYGPNGCLIWGPVDPFTRMPVCRQSRMGEMVPPVDRSGAWTVESTMDVQWAHAIAPKAKILLIQAPNNFASALSFAVQYASTVADTVSMSWGGREAAFTRAQLASVPSGRPNDYSTGGFDHIAFSRSGVTYVAASGDWGNINIWPAVSPRVLAVGGTNVSGPVDVGWSGSGGGISRYFAPPAWQASLRTTGRAVPDVAYNADPRTAFSIYVTPQVGVPDTRCVQQLGADRCGWYGAYGTSAGTPQWAGLIAIARARRAELGRPNIDYVQAIYAIASNPAYYPVAFGDVLTGNNGFPAGPGFDLVTGLGVPRARQLVDLLVAM